MSPSSAKTKVRGSTSALTRDMAVLGHSGKFRTIKLAFGKPFPLDFEPEDVFLESQPVSGPLWRRDHSACDLVRIDPEIVDQPHVLAQDTVRDRGQQMHVQFGEQVRCNGDTPGVS